MSIKVDRESSTRGYPIYYCSKCQDDFYSYASLMDHMKDEHDYTRKTIQSVLDESSLNHFSLIQKLKENEN